MAMTSPLKMMYAFTTLGWLQPVLIPGCHMTLFYLIQTNYTFPSVSLGHTDTQGLPSFGSVSAQNLLMNRPQTPVSWMKVVHTSLR